MFELRGTVARSGVHVHADLRNAWEGFARTALKQSASLPQIKLEAHTGPYTNTKDFSPIRARLHFQVNLGASKDPGPSYRPQITRLGSYCKDTHKKDPQFTETNIWSSVSTPAALTARSPRWLRSRCSTARPWQEILPMI